MAPLSPLAVGDQNATVVIVIKSGPLDRRSSAQIRRYRFGGCFAKEPLSFLKIKPEILSLNLKPEFYLF
jgi:hypothetical protein